MSDEPRDYAVLISLYMREEAEVMASALRAEGIDAFVGNAHHANVDWGWTIALGGMQVFVPRSRIDDAKSAMRARWKEASENPEGEPVKRRDRYKAWLVIGGYLGTVVFYNWASQAYQEQEQRFVEEYFAEQATPALFSAPTDLSAAEREAVLLDYCVDFPWHRVSAPGDRLGDIVQCADILYRN